MIINTTEDLKKLCKELSKSSYIALDTEFIREKTYYSNLCLIQIASAKKEACIDPLADKLDLTPLFDLLQNKKVVKVLHAARQDIEIFYQLTGKIPTPLFDTQIAAMICGYNENVGYQQLVQDICGVQLDKSLRITDWSRRPLDPKQVKYALNDVTYLRDIYKEFKKRIKKSGHQEWLSEELKIQNDPKTYHIKDSEVWKKFKTSLSQPLHIYIFSKLCEWRECLAKKKNLPRKYILRDEALVELSALMPKTPEKMNACRNLPKSFCKSSYGKEILSIIEEAKKDSPQKYPKISKIKSLSAAQRSFFDVLRILLNVISENLGVAPRIIASTEDLQEIAKTNKNNHCLTGWRRDVFGKYIVALKEGKLFLFYNPQTRKLEMVSNPSLISDTHPK